MAHVKRQGVDVGRDHVKRLMRTAGLQGAKRRGKPWRTTIPDPAATRAPDRVEHDFTATRRPDQLWVTDFTYLRCWEGLVFFSFVIEAFSRLVVGWQFSASMRTDLVLDELRMALTRRQAGAMSSWSSPQTPARIGGFKWSSQRLDRGVAAVRRKRPGSVAHTDRKVLRLRRDHPTYAGAATSPTAAA